MKIILATTQAPFIHGGAEILAHELRQFLKLSGHEVEILSIPFQYYPPERILDTMLMSRLLDFEHFNGSKVDRVIGLKFPAYLMPHPCKVLWLLHQFRQAYELWGDPIYGYLEKSPKGLQIRESIVNADNLIASECKEIFTISKTVSKRLKTHNDTSSKELYHPPQNAEMFHCSNEIDDYIFYPSRMNIMKRQNLVVEALAKTINPVKLVFAGKPEGDFEDLISNQIKALKLDNRVQFLGQISNEEKAKLYARSLGVIYVPFDEDYGYVTLEAMLSSKPTITCRDSGGTLEFIEDKHTGLVVDPTPEAIANAMDELWENRQWSSRLGRSALESYNALNISWSNVIEHLLA